MFWTIENPAAGSRDKSQKITVVRAIALEAQRALFAQPLRGIGRSTWARERCRVAGELDTYVVASDLRLRATVGNEVDLTGLQARRETVSNLSLRTVNVF